MLSFARILVTVHVLAGSAAMLGACGQKGPLVLPGTPESQNRATLPETLNPWHKPAPAPGARPVTAPAAPPAASEAAR